MRNFARRNAFVYSLCLTALGVWLPGSALLAASNGYWTGNGTNGRWDNASNWLSGTAMVGNATAFFNVDVTNNVITVTTTYNCKLVSFDTSAGSYTIGGLGVNGGQTFNPFVSGGGVTLLATITGTNLTETFNAPILLAANDFFNNSCTNSGTKLVIAGNVSCNAASTTTLSSASSVGGTNLISGVIGDGTNSTASVHWLKKTGAGQWTLSGTNTYSGGTFLTAGTLNINTNSALGTGPFIISGGTTNDNTSARPVRLANNAMTWDGNFTFLGTSDLDCGTGAVSLGTSAGATRTITVRASTLTVGGGIADGTTATNIVKTGNGTLALTSVGGTHTYTGATAVNAGALFINGVLAAGGGSVTVTNGAALGGTGFVYRATTVTSNATLAAGASAVPGTLTTTNLTLLGGAIIVCDISGGAMDKVAVNGTLTLPAKATVNVNRSGAWPSPAVLFSAASLAGATNSQQLTGWVVTPPDARVSIQGNTIILAPIVKGTIINVN